MLVLTREVNERVVVGNAMLRITVVDIQEDRVKLGFEADTSIPIYREEVFERILRERQQKQH